MNDIRSRLYDLLDQLNSLEKYIELDSEDLPLDSSTLYDIKGKLRLYISKFFNDRVEFEELISNIQEDPTNIYSYETSIFKLKSIITLLLEDLNLDDNNIKIQTEEEKQQILSQVRKEAEIERERLQNETIEIQKIKESLLSEQQRLTEEEKKYNSFRQKLEVSTEKFDFSDEAKKNKKASVFWAMSSTILIIILFIFLNHHLTEDITISSIALNIKEKLNKDFINQQDIINKSIYIAYIKYIVTKLLLYSMLIYSIVFCVKNYNAQMHNKVINLHKANAFQSIISLLGTAKSDEGNDKLLVQATQAIFSHQNTGYSGINAEPSNPNLVTNIIDSVSKKI